MPLRILLIVLFSISLRAETVQRVIDGDTIVLSDGTKVRLIGVDTPEKSHPLKPVQFYAEKATCFTRKLAEGKDVYLEHDQQRTDKYGRSLAYIYILPDSVFLNEEIIKRGFGFAYTRFPFKYMDRFRETEKDARSRGAGLWADSGFAEVNWLFDQNRTRIEIFDMANNLWGVKVDSLVRPRLSKDDLSPILDSLRIWIYALNDIDLLDKLQKGGWRVIEERR